MNKFTNKEKSHLRDTPYVSTRPPETIQVAGHTVYPKTSYVPTLQTKDIFHRTGVTPVTLHEITDANAFHDAIKQSSNPYSASVEVKSPEELASHRMFVTSDGMAGATLKDDYVGGAFNHNPKVKGFAHAVVPLLIQQGGRRADAFDTVLPSIYAEHGLHTVARVPFNDEFAPKGWDANLYSKYNAGRPDVVLMSYQKKNYAGYVQGQGAAHADWDAAENVMNRSITESTGRDPWYPLNSKPSKNDHQTWPIQVVDSRNRKVMSTHETLYDAMKKKLEMNQEYTKSVGSTKRDLTPYVVPFHDKIGVAYEKESNQLMRDTIPHLSHLFK